ncbi:MAG: hypothetical protein M3O36_01410 [Myxococcota bacterium]|nr:hypothetical protein [Myxococcota bacterium]
MAKRTGDPSAAKEQSAESPSYGTQTVLEGRNHLFVRAFADALRDILREEQRRTAAA